jgi:hypothetical protein
MWCGQVGSISNRWFSSLQFQYLFGAAAGEIAMTVMQDWDAQIAILASPYGAEYDQLLLERFETLRRGMD